MQWLRRNEAREQYGLKPGDLLDLEMQWLRKNEAREQGTGKRDSPQSPNESGVWILKTILNVLPCE
jgi:hypothetical protein